MQEFTEFIFPMEAMNRVVEKKVAFFARGDPGSPGIAFGHKTVRA
ncbi:MAG: hypothetical protein ACE37H_04510 [Phycisphaeraceae bacterium]